MDKSLSHGSAITAYTVVRATQRVNGKWQFWVSELCNPWTDWLKIWHVITSVSWPHMSNFIKFGGTRASLQYGEMYTLCTFFNFFLQISRMPLQKNIQRFQALNGLKCSTVGNLGSQWAFVINVIRVYPLFWRTKSKTINIFELRNFRPRNALQCAFWE